jgi:cytochrome P450
VSPTPQVPTFDLTELTGEEIPDPTLATWREAGPLVSLGPLQWGVTRHADVESLLRDRRLGHHVPWPYLRRVLGDNPTARYRFNSIVNRDPPDHTRLRRLMAQAFGRSFVVALRDWITAVVDDLLVPLRDGAEFDVVTDLAFPLSSLVICELLGIPVDDRERVRTRIAKIAEDRSDEGDEAMEWLRAYIGSVLADRRPDPSGEPLERLLAAEDGDQAFTHAEIVDNVIQMFVAGVEPPNTLLASGCHALLSNGDQRELLWSDSARCTTAVEEMLRFAGLFLYVLTMAREPVEVGGHVIPARQVVYLLLRSANRDPDVFDRPDVFDITRDPNPHLAFGGGPHSCVGPALARMEGEIVFRRLVETTTKLELAGPVKRQVWWSGACPYSSLPITAVAS